MSPRKHTRFFAFDLEEPGFRGPPPKDPSVPYAIADVEAYHTLFDGVTNETAVGEASHSYLYQPMAPERIYRYAPDMKLIAILRNPVERAFSHYSKMVRNAREPVAEFARALEEEEARINDHWWPDFHYVQIGLYGAQLKRYFDLFEREQIKVYLYEDLKSDPAGVLRDVFRFLGVDDGFVPEVTVRYNASGVPTNKALHLFLQRLRGVRPIIEQFVPERQHRCLLRIGSNLHNRNLTRVRLSPELRSRVTDQYFTEDILELQRLIRRDLSVWLE